MNRIDMKFDELKNKQEKALIPFITAGDPTIEKTKELILLFEKNGADIVELGIPYSDPLADGTVIVEAGQRSLTGGFKLKKVFDCVKEVRKVSQIPLVFMCYYNSVFGYGRDKFIGSCVECGIDGIIVPDLPFEEREELVPYLKDTNIHLIPMTALTSRDRIPMITKEKTGFVYCVSSMGVTGVRGEFDKGVDSFLDEVRSKSVSPACVGFGIGKKEDVERFKNHADGVIVGSAIVKKIFETNCDFEKVGAFIKELKAATK